MSFPLILNAKGAELAWIRTTFGEDLGDRSLCGVIDQLSPAGRDLVSALARALFATEVAEECTRVITGTVRPQTSAGRSLEDAIHRARARPPALPQPSVYYVDLGDEDEGP